MFLGNLNVKDDCVTQRSVKLNQVFQPEYLQCLIYLGM